MWHVFCHCLFFISPRKAVLRDYGISWDIATFIHVNLQDLSFLEVLLDITREIFAMQVLC